MGLILRKNLNRPLTAAEVDGNMTFLNIDRWQHKSYSKGQFVYHADVLTGDNVLFTCLVDHDTSVYSSGFVTEGVVNGTYQTIWLQIASSGGLGHIKTITGTTLMGIGVAAPVYAGMTGVTHQFRRIQSMNGNIQVSYDNGTVYLNASGATVPAPVNTYTTSTPSSCYGATDGTLTIHATGGTGNRRFSITNGTTWYPAVGYTTDTSHTFTNLTAGTYTGQIKVQDQVLGLVGTPTGVVGGPLTDVTVTYTTTPATVTGYTDGSITLTVTGGNGSPYYVQLYDSNNIEVASGSDLYNFTNLTNGDYTYYVYDANGSCGYKTGTISVRANYNRIKLSSITSTQPICYNGLASGTITLVNGRGSGNFSYKYDNTSWSSSTTSYSKTFANSLSIGSHTLYAKDALTGQIVSGTTTVTNSLSNPISGFTVSSDQICSSTLASVLLKVKNVSAGTTPQYQDNSTIGSWTNMNLGSSVNLGYWVASILKSTTSSGTLYYRDPTCGIVSGATYSVIKTSQITATQTGSQAPNCPGDNWVYNFTLSNGGGTFEYSLDNSTWTACSSTPSITVTSSATNSASTKTIYFRDAVNVSCTTSVSVNNTKLREITGTTVVSQPTCSNLLGTIALTAKGGFADNTSTFEYRLVTNSETGTTYTTMSGTGTGTYSIGSLSTGIYNVVINRVGNRTCGLAMLPSNITITVPQPLGFKITSQSNPTSCGATDGSATVQFTGGTTSVYDYKIGTTGTWQTNSGAGYSSSVTLTGLSGSIKLFVRDHTYTSCATSPSANNIILTPPSSAVAGASTYTRPTCYGDSASVTLTVASGSGNYRYWYNGTYYPSVGTTTATSYTFTTVTRFTGANSTLFKIVDGSCDTFVSVTGTGTPSALSISSATGVAPTSAGGTGSILVNYAGGTPNFVLSAISGSTTYTTTLSSTSTGTITGIAPGDYTVSIYDHDGTSSFCSFTYSSTVTVPAYSAPPTLYYFRYNFNSPSTAGNYITTNSTPAFAPYDVSVTANLPYYTPSFATATLADTVTYYLSNLSTFAGGSVNLSTAAPSGWGSGSGFFTFNVPSVSWSSNIAIMVPDTSTYTTLKSGTHISDGGLPFNALGRTSVTYGGVNYWIYSVYGASQSSGTNPTIKIQ